MSDPIDWLSLVQAASAHYRADIPTRFVGRSGALELDLAKRRRFVRSSNSERQAPSERSL